VPLSCPVEVFVGTDDPLVSVPDAAAWSVHTHQGCTLHSVPGGHFFPRESKVLFFAGLRAALARADGWRDQAATTVPRSA
jgi:surfactin synthase thioesterase subunit